MLKGARTILAFKLSAYIFAQQLNSRGTLRGELAERAQAAKCVLWLRAREREKATCVEAFWGAAKIYTYELRVGVRVSIDAEG